MKRNGQNAHIQETQFWEREREHDVLLIVHDYDRTSSYQEICSENEIESESSQIESKWSRSISSSIELATNVDVLAKSFPRKFRYKKVSRPCQTFIKSALIWTSRNFSIIVRSRNEPGEEVRGRKSRCAADHERVRARARTKNREEHGKNARDGSRANIESISDAEDAAEGSFVLKSRSTQALALFRSRPILVWFLSICFDLFCFLSLMRDRSDRSGRFFISTHELIAMAVHWYY